MATLYTSKLSVHHSGAMEVPTAARKRLILMRLFVNLLMGVMIGAKRASAFDMSYNTEAGAKATGSVAFATSSGTVGVVINGVTITVVWATSDIVSMSALAAAINASTNPLVQYQVQAGSSRSLVTLTSVPAGAILRIGQFDFTAVANSGLVQNWGDFDISGTDTADATALAAAINGHPQASKYFVATSAAAVVSVFLIALPSAGDGTASFALLSTNTAISIAAQFAPSATAVIASYARDRLANAISTVASGTNVTAATGLLTGGKGGNQIPSQEAV